ncbi:hypothetical protein NCCP1664_06910 [Zafaria cholistanensis]|uniref:AbiEi antitoxin C-terminal domain-containing protein n=1 Tax=Zafaria cholistanensis TaxID=1682741 RepID=A0A5A7NMM2_9MICC|nr:type IV toxin-antitoxin system AbiEi family antitoxin [Zafaria cholistanensis]GER22194.1 hypothetical protein NCCP1664_06910 [Zafaria cholistanensis]
MPAASPAFHPLPHPGDPYSGDPCSGDQCPGIRCPGHPPALFLPGQVFAAAELAAMALEGIVREVLPRAYAPTRTPEGPHLRAAAAGLLAGTRLRNGAVGRLSAAWIHGCGPAPGRLEVLVPRFHRLPARADPLPVHLSEAKLDAEDIVRIGGVPVTSAPRTAVDVALSAAEPEALAVLSRLLGSPRLGCTGPAVLDLLERQARRPGKARARERIERVLGADAGSGSTPSGRVPSDRTAPDRTAPDRTPPVRILSVGTGAGR